MTFKLLTSFTSYESYWRTIAHYAFSNILKNIWDTDLQINLGLVLNFLLDGFFFKWVCASLQLLYHQYSEFFSGLSAWPDWAHCFLLMEHYKNIISYYQEQLNIGSPWLMTIRSAIV